MQTQSIIVAMAFSQLIHFATYFAAGFYAIRQRRRHPTACRCLLFAVLMLCIVRVLSFLTPMVMAATTTPAQLASLIHMLNVVFSILDVFAFGLMVVAIFVKRVPETASSSDTLVQPGSPPQSSGNPYESPM